jgi:hypothetical protein
MEPYDRPPLADYAFKLMLLEAIKCYQEGNKEAIYWIETIMFKMITRWKELDKGDKDGS